MTGHTKEPFTEPKAPLRHSAEPWTTEAFNDIDYGDADYSAMILAGDGESIIAQQMSDHDADRASACVNALATIPDPLAFVQASRGMAEALEACQSTLQHTRAFMLEKHGTTNPAREDALASAAAALNAFRAATGEA